MQSHPLGNFFGKIWVKVIKIWANLIRFGQNQNLASPKTFDLLRLWTRASKHIKPALHWMVGIGHATPSYVIQTLSSSKTNFLTASPFSIVLSTWQKTVIFPLGLLNNNILWSKTSWYLLCKIWEKFGRILANLEKVIKIWSEFD